MVFGNGSSREQRKQIRQEVARRRECQQRERDKEQIDKEIEGFNEERNQIMKDALEQSKTDPVGVRYTIGIGAQVEKEIFDLKANKKYLQYEDILDRLAESKRRIIKQRYLHEMKDPKFFTKRQIDKIKETHMNYTIMKELEDKSSDDVLHIFGYGANDVSGAGSAFEAEYFAKLQQQEVDQIDD